MIQQDREVVERHVKTHSESSDEDRAAVSTLETFLSSGGKINTNFSRGDKWPNSDGTFEFVPSPDVSRQPDQSFYVQIKGTQHYTEQGGTVKYCLRSLAFPAFIYCNVTLDPGILFVVLDPTSDGEKRVFWKYMSVEFINSIDYSKGSATISFGPEEEIKHTRESVNDFCDKLAVIVKQHSFVQQLESREYSIEDVKKTIDVCDKEITESIDRMDFFNETRDDVSRRILQRLEALCVSTLMLNASSESRGKMNIRLAWEHSLLNIETKYLGTFLRALKYIGHRIPDEGQSERLMLRYYNFLWQIRKFLKENYQISILRNLEKFPLHIDTLDLEYYKLVANAVDSIYSGFNGFRQSRYYVQKKIPFYIGSERYYEVTLQLSGIYATKYNRITAYTKENISTNYSVQIGYTDASIDLWGTEAKIKIITNWRVSISPPCLNKLGKALHIPTKISSRHGEYSKLMNFLTQTGISLLDLIDFRKDTFSTQLNQIYSDTNSSAFRPVLQVIKDNYSSTSTKRGRNVVRYLLLNLREETFENILPTKYSPKCLSSELAISSSCFPFDKNPFISNLAGSKTSENIHTKSIVNIAGRQNIDVVLPYLHIKNAIKQTGEIYFAANSIASDEAIDRFNTSLDSWERTQGHLIKREDGLVCIDSYEKTTIDILAKLLELASTGNKGQKELNRHFIKQSALDFSDPMKKCALENAFVNSRVLLIYGAAGTGKTTLINYISNLMAGRRKLFLTKTHAALQNLKRRIEYPGANYDFISIDSFSRRVTLSDYDIIFVDECSTIDNRTMLKFLQKLNPNAFLVLAGDIHQIESIDFGNWFFYAKDIIRDTGANVELLGTWRTQDTTLIELWDEVRTRNDLITEKLVIDGPFSEDIGPKVLIPSERDEVVLCLNYDGKFGLNNMNNYFQNANKNGPAVSWQEWTYKIGDPILFCDTKRFPILYNNLKGRIVAIHKEESSISFTIDVETLLTEQDCQNFDLDYIKTGQDYTRIHFTVYAYDSTVSDEEEDSLRMRSVIPFQLAYAVSIHKAQGLEYNSVKVVIPSSNSERITHGIFYTAITRAKKKLTIYWSSETMKEIVTSFYADESTHRSLEIIKSKLRAAAPVLNAEPHYK